MNNLLEIIHITLIYIAKSVYNYWYLMVIWIVYFLINKTKSINIYNLEASKSPLAAFIESIFQGIIVGIIGSLITILLGLPIHLSLYLIFLLPISLALSLINVRYICLSYSATILGLLSITFNGQTVLGVTLPLIDINVNGLIALVGILHLMESILIYFVGAQDCVVIPAKKNNQIVFGHVLQKYWPIPIAILFITSGTVSGDAVEMPTWWPILKYTGSMSLPLYYGLMPLVGVLGYNNITFTEEPEKRAKKTAGLLFAYSVLMITLAILSKDQLILNIIGLILMATIHEGIMLIEQKQENSNSPIYTVPEKGVRIMQVIKGSLADKAGMKKGTIIKKINNIELKNTLHYKEIMKEGLTFLWLETEGLDNSLMVHEIKAYPSGVENIGIKLMPENPRVLFKYENLNKLGMIHLIKDKYMKK